MKSHRTRPPAVADLFYPGNAQILKNQITEFLDAVHSNEQSACPKALIVPHAGYIYSGPVAASAFHQLLKYKTEIRKIVLIGPAHRVYLDGIALSSATDFQTPLGSVPLDEEGAAELEENFHFINYNDDAHAEEHSLEVQLPFLQTVLQDFSILPMLVGQSNADQVADVISQLIDNANTLIIISTDLSHYLPYKMAQKVDQKAVEAISKMDHKILGHDNACGRHPVNGLLLTARREKMNVNLLDLRNSGDTAGTKDQVVGYGAWAFYPGN